METSYLSSMTKSTFMRVIKSLFKLTQPSIPPGSVNEDQLWLERQRQE